ncbi:aldehyde dehydrogenase [Cristinia sonorae]|uniref:Aldehyde dehydrogenase n=1 Tax=Cristinia sonorae TaxID=1940300 RepID=A0A8K0UJ64_9AGAR|nr:aldehyde dehydrogenase [Cristinia sonorae]
MKDPSIHFTSLLVDGEFRPSLSDKSFEVRNPYTGLVVGHAASATSEDCKDAIETAGKAFSTWEHSTFEQRRSVFLKAADLLETERYKEKIISAIRDETAAADHMHYFNTASPAAAFRDVAGLVGELKGETFPSQIPGGHVVAQRRAMGVIFAVSPWNAPMLLSVRAVAVPIICGNTVVFKCSEVTPRTQSIVAEVLFEAGLPRGVLNFLCMDTQDAPSLTSEIIAHPLIRKINFTGSDRVGRILAIEAAKYLKPCVFELGGKAPVVVLDDADTEQASRAIVSSAIMNSGQICMSTERVIVQRKAAETLVPAITKLMGMVKAGDYRTHPERLSSLFAEGSAANLVSMITEAEAEGAIVMVGDKKREGAIVQPHVLMNVRPGMKMWDRETFGPVLVIAVADTIDEIIEVTNASDYTLVAGLWTKDVHTALDVAGRVRSGWVNINGPSVHLEAMRGHCGLGGASGYGHFDIDNFTDVRMIVIHPAGPRQYPLVG